MKRIENMDQNIKAIEDALKKSLTIEFIQIEDQGHLHKGHKAANEGLMHLKACIVSDDFLGLNSIKRHQKVYGALAKFLENRLHALSLETYSVKEYHQRD
jgi:BolA protein